MIMIFKLRITSFVCLRFNPKDPYFVIRPSISVLMGWYDGKPLKVLKEIISVQKEFMPPPPPYWNTSLMVEYLIHLIWNLSKFQKNKGSKLDGESETLVWVSQALQCLGGLTYPNFFYSFDSHQ